MMKRSLLILAVLLLGCHPAPPSDQERAHRQQSIGASGGSSSRIADVLSVAVCRELDGHLFPLASNTGAGPDTIDMYVLPKRCEAKAALDSVHIVADAFAWLAVDREVSGIRVQEFAHTTVHVDVTMHTRAQLIEDEEGNHDHLEITLTPMSKMDLKVEPLGALELDPTNWAALLALELAPSAGQSPEWIAKQKLRTEAEQALTKALVGSGAPLVVKFDGKSGAVWFSETRPKPPPPPPRADMPPIGTTFRLTPRGTALLGTFAPSTAASSASVVVEVTRKIYVRALCTTHAERILDADRRGDEVDLSGWQELEEHWHRDVHIPPMPCRWMLAMRAAPHQTVRVELAYQGPPDNKRRSPEGDRWVAIDKVSIHDRSAPAESVDPEEIVLATDVWSMRIDNVKECCSPPPIVVLSPNQTLMLRALYPHDGSRRAGEVVAEAEVTKLDGSPITLLGKTTRRNIASVEIKTRARDALPPIVTPSE